MIKKLASVCMSAALLIGLNASVHAEEVSSTTGSSVEKKELKTLFLDKPTRLKIDKQREAYLKPTAVKKADPILPKEVGKSKKPKVKRIYIPPRVAVSAVVVKPDGSRIVRVNKKYNRSPSKHINMDFAHSTSDGVPVTIQGKTKVVPVGSTLLTRKNRLVKTYKLDEAKRKKVAPKTKQVAVKERLKQVQILTPKDQPKAQKPKELPSKEVNAQ